MAKTGNEILYRLMGVNQQTWFDIFDAIQEKDDQSAKLLVPILHKLSSQLEISGGAMDAITRLVDVAKSAHKWQPSLLRNNIFKAADSLGIPLPSGHFASEKTGAQKVKFRGVPWDFTVLHNKLGVVYAVEVDGEAYRISLDNLDWGHWVIDHGDTITQMGGPWESVNSEEYNSLEAAARELYRLYRGGHLRLASKADQYIASKLASLVTVNPKVGNEVMSKLGWGRHLPVMPREFYLPEKVRNAKPIIPEGTDLAIWKWDDPKPTAIAFAGKANKPLWYHTFHSDAERDKHIQSTIAGRQSRMQYKQKVQQERRDYQHDFKVGDILSGSWGYDQTNREFAIVTAVKGKQVAIREIGSKVDHSGQGVDYLVPDPDKLIGPPMIRIPRGGSVKFKDLCNVSKWDGKPEYETALGWGH